MVERSSCSFSKKTERAFLSELRLSSASVGGEVGRKAVLKVEAEDFIYIVVIKTC